MTHTDDARLVERALRNETGAVTSLLRRITPVIHVRVGRALLADPYGSPKRNLREETEDLTQDVLVLLFERDARVLRRWDPAKGLSLRNFVGIVAQRHAGAVLGARRRNPWYAEPVEPQAVERALVDEGGVEASLAAKEAWQAAMAAVAEDQTDRGRRLAEMIFRDGLTNEEIQDRTAMSSAAVYKWRSRLTQAFRRHLTEALRGVRAPEELSL
jgi:RNA polymerase sigma-70 factor (ECF subfamily)